MSIITVKVENDLIISIVDYLKTVFIWYELVKNKITYLRNIKFMGILSLINILITVLSYLLYNYIKLSILLFIINFQLVFLIYYFLYPSIEISLMSFLCEGGQHKYLNTKCFSDSQHIIILIVSILLILFMLFISIIYSFYYTEIGTIFQNINKNNCRVKCNYELYCIIVKVVIFVLGFLIQNYFKEKHFMVLLYEGIIFILCLIMSFFIYKKLFYYNTCINNMNHYGWYLTTWFCFFVLIKQIFHLQNITYYVIFGWIIIIVGMNKTNNLNRLYLLTEMNMFEDINILLIEKYAQYLLNLLDLTDCKSKILLYGIVKKWEDVVVSNQEIDYHYKKLLKDKYLSTKFNKDDVLPVLSIIYIIYSFHLQKSVDREEIILHMCYFLINKFKNPTYAMSLCSSLKTTKHINLYYKYMLMEDIKEHLISKLNKAKNKESIKHVQIGSVILYNLYTELFKIKIYDAVTNQIDYFNLLKNNVTTNKTTENFLKTGEAILKLQKEINNIWEKILELNPFSDESEKDYLLYLESIMQDDFLVKNAAKNYFLLKSHKLKERNNIYHSMFKTNLSSVLLIDGHLSFGKILYSSPNFPFLFMYSGKEILNTSVDDLLPNVIQSFHKELIEDAMKYSNINFVFKKSKNVLLKSKNGGLFNIDLFVKPVPNLCYGLIYFSYVQKKQEPKFIILVDKDFKINGFTETTNSGYEFTMNNNYNLSQNLCGHHISLIIPDILLLLEYKSQTKEFVMTKTNYDLKGSLCPINNNIRALESKIEPIIERITNNDKMTLEENLIQNNQDSKNGFQEYNDLIQYLKIQNTKLYSIFYKVIRYSFIGDKFKYYRIYISNDFITGNEEQTLNKKETEILDNSKKQLLELQKNRSKEGILKKVKIQEDKKSDKNKNEDKELNPNNNDENKEEENYDSNSCKRGGHQKETNNENKNDFGQLMTLSTSPAKAQRTSDSIEFNQIKNEIINKTEIFPLKIMKFLCLIFGASTIGFMIYDIKDKRKDFDVLSSYLTDNLFFNKTKILLSCIYISTNNLRWVLNGCYGDENRCLNNNCETYYIALLEKCIKKIRESENSLSKFDNDYKHLLFEQKMNIDLEVYLPPGYEHRQLNYDNVITFIINTGIKILETVIDANRHPEVQALHFVNSRNLGNQCLRLYYSDISGFQGSEKLKRVDKKISTFPISFLICGVILLCLLIGYIYLTLILHNIEVYLLEKLINLNSVNFENYFKKLVELKKKLRNDNNEEEEKNMEDSDINDSKRHSRKGEFNEGSKGKESLDMEEDEKKRYKKRGGNKQNKLLQQKKKKIQVMSGFFVKTNFLFGLKIIIIMVLSLTYYIVSLLLESENIKEYLSFDDIHNSIEGIFKNSYEIFLGFQQELDKYKNSLSECSENKTTTEIYKMSIPLVDEIQTPKFGNLLMQISNGADFNKETIKQFSQLYNEDACKLLTTSDDEYETCESFWSGILLKGMEQAITQMGVVISSVLDEFNSMNDRSKTFKQLLLSSSYHQYEEFVEYYMLVAYEKTSLMFTTLRTQKLVAINSNISTILIVYIIAFIVLFFVLVYFIYSIRYIFNSFMNFIGIMPTKYLSDDQGLYKEILNLGQKYY